MDGISTSFFRMFPVAGPGPRNVIIGLFKRGTWKALMVDPVVVSRFDKGNFLRWKTVMGHHVGVKFVWIFTPKKEAIEFDSVENRVGTSAWQQ